MSSFLTAHQQTEGHFSAIKCMKIKHSNEYDFLHLRCLLQRQHQHLQQRLRQHLLFNFHMFNYVISDVTINTIEAHAIHITM